MSGSKISISVRKEERFPNQHRSSRAETVTGPAGYEAGASVEPKPAVWPIILPALCLGSSGSGHLHKISREFQFEVCICGEPSLSPQSARAREHFYRGEEEVGMALSESWLFSG